MIEQNYSAGIMSQSFWFNEFRQLLKLKRENCEPDEMKKRVIEENLFGAPNEYRAKRIYGYLINRVSLVEKELSDLFFFFRSCYTKAHQSYCCSQRGQIVF